MIRNLSCLFIFLTFFQYLAAANAQNISIYDRTQSRTVGVLESFSIDRLQYVSVTKLAGLLNITSQPNPAAKQIQLKLPDLTVTIMAISPFVMFNELMLQMPAYCLYKNNDYLAPARYFIPLLADHAHLDIEYNESANTILITSSRANINNVIVEEMENGFLLRITTSKEFPLANIFTSESNGWFYVDFFGGLIDTFQTFTVNPEIKSIKKIVPIQLSDDTARLSFRVTVPISEKNTYIKSATEVTVTLRTRQKISEGILADLEKEREKWKIDTIIIDPGHGGRDPGAIGSSNTFEKKITLAIAKELKAELEKKLDIKVLMTREADIFPSLKERTKFANTNKGKLFLSIHTDSNPVSRLHGHTAYILGPAKTEEARRVAQFENSVIRLEDTPDDYTDLTDASFILASNAQNSFTKESEELAALIDVEIRKKCNSYSQGVKQAGFQVLYGASMPCILLETGFLSNPQDEQKLKSKSYQQDIAAAVCEGIIKFKERYESFNN
ncbi:MAG TPA: N-acetylmuramoyl-L-alanine amidase [bacterium]|nr:N-acetylmuramoyl-L-alanine amidase [bacterium]HPN46135.1 N-acetylmuramoyl-L-alanine amidase [bacterium]